MKILLINTVPTEQNGITGVIFNYLKAIDANGMTFDLLSLNNPERLYWDVIEQKGGNVYVLPRLDGVWKYWSGLRKLIKANKYDAVHIHGNSHTVVLELSAAFAAGCVVRIVHSHTTTCLHVVVSRLLTHPFNMLYTHGLACGEAAGRWMFGEQKFTVINNGVDTNLYSFDSVKRKELRGRFAWENCKVIGHVGGMVETKNHQFIIDVFNKLHKRDTSYRLLLIGDGPLRQEVEKKVEEYGLNDRVCMKGNINNVCDYLNVMDLVLMPSLFEGLPLTLVEQQANGLRCVVSDAITKEADKTRNLFFLPLSMGASGWAERINEITMDSEKERKQRSDMAVADITKSGYSIKEEAKKLKNYYVKAILK